MNPGQNAWRSGRATEDRAPEDSSGARCRLGVRKLPVAGYGAGTSSQSLATCRPTEPRSDPASCAAAKAPASPCKRPVAGTCSGPPAPAPLYPRRRRPPPDSPRVPNSLLLRQLRSFFLSRTPLSRSPSETGALPARNVAPGRADRLERRRPTFLYEAAHLLDVLFRPGLAFEAAGGHVADLAEDGPLLKALVVVTEIGATLA